MTRRGKIARIPHSIREQINRRLQNGEEGKQIAEWLNTLPEVQALMAAEFDGQPVNEPNLSHWKLGGYRDWQAQQDSVEAVRCFGADAAQLSREAGGQLADQLALCLTARVAIALRRFSPGRDDLARELELLRLLRSNLVALRKGDHNAQWLRIEQGKLDLSLKKYRDIVAARRKAEKKPKPTGDGSVPKEVFDEFSRRLGLI